MKVEVKRIDHLGLVAGIVKELGIVELIDELLGHNEQQEITAGEAVAGMILNGLGFVSRPLMLTPQFFENKALDCLLREGVTPEHFNRHKLGRVFDAIGDYGCEKLFASIALEVCKKEKIDTRFGHDDTTSYSLTGDYDSDTDTERINITYGHSKDQRPDLKQVIQELLISNDGGVPLMTKTWNGNASDNVILRERAKHLIKEFGKTSNRFFVADSKLYSLETAEILDQINFITRVPATLKLEQETIARALQKTGTWHKIDHGYKLQEFAVDLYGIHDQRWVVVFSEQAQQRVEKTLKKEVSKEAERIKKELYHLHAQQFACQIDAEKKVKSLPKKWKYHAVSELEIVPVKCYVRRGRPKPEDNATCQWQVKVQYAFNKEMYNAVLNQRSCFVVATNVQVLTAEEVLTGYKGQDMVEKGFAFLKGSEFFTSSLFLKKPSRIEALLMIMVLSLLVYSVAQRRLRIQLSLLKSTLPNQIKQPTARPTMRWIFQLFEGINYVTVTIKGTVNTLVEGLNELRIAVINMLGPAVQRIYKISCSGVDQ